MNDNSPRPLSLFTELGSDIMQSDRDVLRKCPNRTQVAMNFAALLMLASLIVQTGTITLLTHLLLDTWEFRPLYVVPAALVALIIQLSDTTALIKSSEAIQGLEQLRRGGLQIAIGINTRIKQGIQTVVRMAFGLVYAQLTAIGLTLLIFNPDITRILTREATQANVVIIEKAATLYDGKTTEETGRLDVVKAAQAKAIEDAATMRRDALTAATPDPAYVAALDQIRRYEASREQLLQRLAEAERFSSAELDGRRVGPGSSGSAGDGLNLLRFNGERFGE